VKYEDVTDKKSIKYIHFTIEDTLGQAENHVESYRQYGGELHVTKLIKKDKEFVDVFNKLITSGTKLSGFDIHAHGAVAATGFEPPTNLFSTKYLKAINKAKYHEVMDIGAEIYLLGCLISNGAWGELFLTQVGEAFLSTGGGKVMAHRTSGSFDFIDNNWRSEPGNSLIYPSVIRNSTTLKTAVVRSNGKTSKIINARYLTSQQTTKALNLFIKSIEKYPSNFQRNSKFNSVLVEARKMYMQTSSLHNDYEKMCDIHNFISIKTKFIAN
jgi:hypothetical protein